MKKIIYSLTLLVLSLLTSCVTTYYQVYKASSIDKISYDENYLFYEDINCKIIYNFWSSGGEIGFKFYNKTDKTIYLNLDDCYFVMNGISYDYYNDRIFTDNITLGISNGVSTKYNIKEYTSSNSHSISINEKKIISIPSQTSKIISEYKINQKLYQDCDLLKYPSIKKIKKINFSKNNSPIIFSNRISYNFGQNEKIIKIENSFYVSEITNIPESNMLEEKIEDPCAKKHNDIFYDIQQDVNEIGENKSFKKFSPDMFFIKYKNIGDNDKY